MLLFFFGDTSWHAGSCSLIRDQTLCSLQWKHITQPLEHQGFPVHALLNEAVIHFLSHSSFLVPSGPLWLVATILFRGVCVWLLCCFGVLCMCVTTMLFWGVVCVWLLYCFGVFFSVCVTTMLFRGVCMCDYYVVSGCVCDYYVVSGCCVCVCDYVVFCVLYQTYIWVLDPVPANQCWRHLQFNPILTLLTWR